MAHVLIEHNVRTATWLTLRRQVRPIKTAWRNRRLVKMRSVGLSDSVRSRQSSKSQQGVVDLTVQELHPLNVRIGGRRG